MNILMVSEYYYANPDFVRLSIELAKRKHNVSVATSFRTTDKRTEGDVQVFEIKPFATIYKIPYALSFPLSQLRRIIKEQSIDVIHAVSDYSTNTTAAALVAKTTKKPLVLTIQGISTKTGQLLVDSLVKMYEMTAGRLVANEARSVIILSKNLIVSAEKISTEKSKIVVIPSGVDTAHFNPNRSEVKKKASQLKTELDLGSEIIVGYVGRLYPAKGLTYLFSAVKELQDKHPNIALLIVGEGAQRNELEAIAKDLKVRTIFAGWQRDIAPYYSLMDIFVLPSLFEGLPNVLLEAMSMKIALIATNVGGNPDLLTHGENGFLVPVRDASKLACALEKLIEDDELRIKMGANNRRKVEEHFQWSQTIEEVEKVYREIT